jgi:hypothetical protein
MAKRGMRVVIRIGRSLTGVEIEREKRPETLDPMLALPHEAQYLACQRSNPPT